MRSCAFLLIGLFALGVADFNTFDFPHRFGAEQLKCQDFYAATCNFATNRNKSFTAELRDRFYDDVLKLVLNYDLGFKDPIFSYMREIFMHETYDARQFNDGEALARQAYEGERYPVITEDYEHKKQLNVLANGGKGKLINETCAFTKCPAFIQGIAYGYKKLTDRHSRMDMATWTVKASYRNPGVDFLETKKTMIKEFKTLKGNKDFHLKLLRSTEMAPYVNMVIMKLMIENKKLLSKQKRATLTKFYGLIRDEFIASIKSISWLSEKDKKQAMDMVKKLETNVYFSDKIDNLAIYKDALKFYQDEVKKNLGKMTYKTGVTTYEKLMNHLRVEVHKAFRHYLNREKSNGSFLRHLNGERPIYEFNPLHQNDLQHIAFYPAVSHYLQQKLPYGIQFGAVGFAFAREMFARMAKDFKLNPTDAEKLKKVQRCYADYYQSFGVKQRDGELHFNERNIKVRDGIADVEAMRIAYNALIKSDVYRGFKSSMSMSAFNDVEWFFHTALLGTCDERADLEQYEALRGDSLTRLNAIVRQMPQFSRLFRCGAGDKMRAVEKICQVFA
ncbi:hypothetical protein QR680_007570 [Steinernema hermaphroditum]|uniref:Peptidase M13 C-terminal domain-containing protein n=1 Tax=Steinernema hermaphroditum TaxID=289476 RepID=A0AA39M6C1_9BILA|nr:hypothetical protein QR680_007570 [Steinernema hermaphroditum]